MQDFYSLLRQLVREPAVVGLEDLFFQIIRRELEDLSIEVTQYLGLLVATGKNPTRGYVSAHVDRNGLLCTGPNEFQYAAFIAGNRGELNGDSISEQFMDTIAGRFRGSRVEAHSPRSGVYLGQAEILDASICTRRRNLIFKLDGLEFLQPGTPISFVDRLQVTEQTISAQLDNVVSVAMAIDLFRQGYQGTAFFTAGEEGGRSWRYLAEWFQRHDQSTDRLIVLDTSPFPDMKEVGKQDVVLRWKDANGEFNRKLTKQIAVVCDEMSIRYCFKDEYIEAINKTREKPQSLGRTELGRLISALRETVQGTTIQLPTTAYHTQSETANRTAVEAMMSLLNRLLID
ncbi:peptidase M42 [Rhodopirellula sp. MGV]|uniref:peptidase M42 n=1 Tax=Rhodopirellula sp. MGV TaxID=2023130 RepID=UPI000B961D56|nr:peptidase M42 [Rhodopirellula sp. MGV]OYP31139.1 peptidase M42 [Rhodopirellula sp. MGV]PNY36038.1 peptidase M42 [Rhodopirellula baltica]